MTKLSKYCVFISGILSPPAAILFYGLVYGTLTQLSSNLEKDWLFRLSLATLAMSVPFLITLIFAIRDYRQRAFSISGKIGVVIAVLSLGLAWKPVNDGMTRSKQSKNQAMHDVDAPLFDTADLLGQAHRLADQKGKVVLVNIWATWCGPCRKEMPELDRLYRERKERGLMVFGLSLEDVNQQRRFATQVPVSYPLLTLNGQVPPFYRDIARYPANFLIDPAGRLQAVPGPDQQFEKIEARVDAMLSSISGPAPPSSATLHSDDREANEVRTGESIAGSVAAVFDPLPAGWVAEQEVMDSHWDTLGFGGVNYYAFGGPAASNKYAARSDPNSPLYQAWFGVYTVSGGKNDFQSGSNRRDFQSLVKLAEYDQRSWLQAMGDPNPIATADSDPRVSNIIIDGSERTMYSFDMKSHSDLCSASTPLAKLVGMPSEKKWQDQLAPFHEIILHVNYAHWYDQQHDLTVVVYGASSAFRSKSGRLRDNGQALGRELLDMMGRVRLVDVQPAGP